MSKPKVVIVGGGFGGLYAARALKNAPVDVLLVNRTNHHVFQPLLYQVATATLSPADICAPIRWLLRHQANADVLLAEVVSVDPAARVATCVDGRELNFDFLILASGARHSYFGHPEWEAVAPGLKSVEDAIELRRRWLSAFERADAATSDQDRAAELTFVVIGGGATGVELAGMLPTIAKHALPQDFRNIDTRQARVILLEGGPRILPAFPEDLSAAAERALADMGVEVRTGHMVTNVADDCVEVRSAASDEVQRIETGTIIWAAGNAASPLGAQLGVPVDRAGRVIVNDDLSVPGHPNIFVIGDLAELKSDGKAVPGVAPAAMQSGRAAARNIVHTVRGEGRERFRYRNKGDLATIGRFQAVGVLAGQHLSGVFAWWTWLLVHIMYLAGFRSRAVVLIEWGYSFFTYNRGARLITGPFVVPKRSRRSS